MLSFGEQLYRMTPRDEETLKLEPFFRQAVANIGAIVPAAAVSFVLPADRSFYLHSVSWQGQPDGTTIWETGVIELVDADPTIRQRAASVLNGDRASARAALLYVQPELIVPPATRQVNLSLNRSVTTAAASAIFWLTGYLIPPGGIGRV